MPDIGNEFWGPSCILKWLPKKPLFEKEDCSCQFRGAFWNMYGDDDVCDKCQERGYNLKNIEASMPKPEWPEDYVKYMKKCHQLYIKRTRKFRG